MYGFRKNLIWASLVKRTFAGAGRKLGGDDAIMLRYRNLCFEVRRKIMFVLPLNKVSFFQ